jgi:hypothetical protein
MTIFANRTAPVRQANVAMELLKVALVSLGLAFTGLAHGDWELENSSSSLAFVSVKNAAIAEAHSFTSLSGLVDKTGAATVQVQLDSAETMIPIRNERLRSMLFATDSFPLATITTKLELAPLLMLGSGAALTLDLPLTINLHGISVTKTVPVRVVSLAADRYLVSAIKPLVVNAAEFGLLPGIEALREVAGLQSITPAVPVSFTLVFRASAQ